LTPSPWIDVPGARNRIATDPGQVRGVRQTAGPSAQRRILYARIARRYYVRHSRVYSRDVYEQLRGQRREREKEREREGREENTEKETKRARRASSRRMRRDNDGRI